MDNEAALVERSVVPSIRASNPVPSQNTVLFFYPDATKLPRGSSPNLVISKKGVGLTQKKNTICNGHVFSSIWPT